MPPPPCQLDIDRCNIKALLSQQIDGHYINGGDGVEKYSLSMLFFQGYNKQYIVTFEREVHYYTLVFIQLYPEM